MSVPARSRRARVREPDPVRLPLPGQDPAREAHQLARLTEQFKPTCPVEEMWVEDIAWCSTNIEHIRAMIAAHRKRCIEHVAYLRQTAAPPMRYGPEDVEQAPRGQADDPWLRLMQAEGYSRGAGRSYLGDATFAGLLGAVGEKEQQQMRNLQTMLHEEVRERDRVIRQITRSRQQDMIEAIAVLEAQGWVHPDRALAIGSSEEPRNADHIADTASEGQD